MANLIPPQRDLFDIPERVAYLNAATMTPLPTAAVEAGMAGLARKQQPWTLTSDQFFADTRSLRPKLARLINADTGGIALCPSASYGLATAARNLPVAKGQSIVTLSDQFPSNVYAWRALADRTRGEVLSVAETSNTSLTERVLEAIGPATAIVALPQVRWTDGARLDLGTIGKRCRETGAALVLDLSQSCGALAFDVQEVQPDFLVSVGYKWLFGPYGVSFMYAAPQHRDGIPLEENWITRQSSEDFSRLTNYQDAYNSGAERYDMGERSNFALLPALEASVDLLLEWGIARVEASLADYNRNLASKLADIGLAALDETRRGVHYLGVGLGADAPDDLIAELRQRDIHVSRRASTLRITPHLYNTEADGDRLVEALADILR